MLTLENFDELVSLTYKQTLKKILGGKILKNSYIKLCQIPQIFPHKNLVAYGIS